MGGALLTGYGAAARDARLAARKRKLAAMEDELVLPCDEAAPLPTLPPVPASALRPGITRYHIGNCGPHRASFDRLVKLQRWMVQTASANVAKLEGSYELAFGFNGWEKKYTGGSEPTLRTRPASVLKGEVAQDLQSMATWVLRSLPMADRQVQRWLAIAQFTSVPAMRLRDWHHDPHLEDGDAVATLTLCGSGWVQVGVKEDADQQCGFGQQPGLCYSLLDNALQKDKHCVQADVIGRFSLTLRFKVKRCYGL